MNILKTPRSFRFFMNLYPPYFFTRTRVTYISQDFKEVIVKLKKSIMTRNYVGTTFGGSIYAAGDPFFMLMLIQILGIKEFIVWDQDAKIEFLKPARSTLTYHFKITEENLAAIHKELEESGLSRPIFTLDITDEEGQVCARLEKGLYIRKKSGTVRFPG